jgi:hypothetical protein
MTLADVEIVRVRDAEIRVFNQVQDPDSDDASTCTSWRSSGSAC